MVAPICHTVAGMQPSHPGQSPLPQLMNHSERQPLTALLTCCLHELHGEARLCLHDPPHARLHRAPAGTAAQQDLHVCRHSAAESRQSRCQR